MWWPTLRTRLSLAQMRLSLAQTRLSLAQMRLSLAQMRLSLAQMRLSLAQMRLSLAQTRLSLAQMRLSLAQMRLSLAQTRLSLAQTRLSLARTRWPTARTRFRRVCLLPWRARAGPIAPEMKKRLRKKKHRGEFTEFGRQLVIQRNGEDGIDEFLDAFLEEAVEANSCGCGGSVLGDRIDFVVELGCRAEDPAAKFAKISAWLDARSDVQSWKAGEEFDIWHGGYQCIAEEGEVATA
jgi:uncharacterized protein YggL (DUF469 family)